MDFDDEKSFGIVDLRRHAPRSIYDVSVGGVAGLARAIDKARACPLSHAGCILVWRRFGI